MGNSVQPSKEEVQRVLAKSQLTWASYLISEVVTKLPGACLNPQTVLGKVPGYLGHGINWGPVKPVFTLN
jgi:hypothetical protein